MISLSLAQELQEAGLDWTPALHDFFAVPDRGLDNVVFVINNISIRVERMKGRPAVTFHGVAERALDFVMLVETVWLPTDEQLRELLAERLQGEPEPILQLTRTADGYRCQIQVEGKRRAFKAEDASEAYGTALLYALQRNGTSE